MVCRFSLQTLYGFEGIIVDTVLYSAKIIIVKEGEQTPYVYQKKQDKTIYVLQGIINLKIENSTKMLNEGDRQHIGPKIMYSIHAIKGDATILEVGTRLEDDTIEVSV